MNILKLPPHRRMYSPYSDDQNRPHKIDYTLKLSIGKILAISCSQAISSSHTRMSDDRTGHPRVILVI